MQTTYETIPQPRPYPVVGNLFDLRPPNPVQSLMGLARQFGPIYRMRLPDRKFVVLSSQALVNEVCDETRFQKNLSPALRNVRAFGGDGLFTSWTHEPNWRKAHNILLPNFSQQAMHGYFPMMVEMTDQLLDKWQRLNAGDEVNVVDDMTRLTFDTIGLCGFNYRFNSFYREDSHPFVTALLQALTESLRHSLASRCGRRPAGGPSRRGRGPSPLDFLAGSKWQTTAGRWSSRGRPPGR